MKLFLAHMGDSVIFFTENPQVTFNVVDFVRLAFYQAITGLDHTETHFH